MADYVNTPVWTGRKPAKGKPGDRYGRLTVLEYISGTKTIPSRLLCRCDCGKEISANASKVYSGHTSSCGCLKQETWLGARRTHGRSNDYLHDIWQSIKNRCTNKNDQSYLRYGAKGVYICDEWRKSFVAFAEGVGERPSAEHSLDRVNPWRGYEPGNTRWSTSVEQRANQIPTWSNLLTGMRYGFYRVSLTVSYKE
jgi:hypothetical protein